MAIASAGCGEEPPPAALLAALSPPEADSPPPAVAPAVDDCRPLEWAPPGAIEALEDLQRVRRAAGLVPVVDANQSSPDFAAQLARLEETIIPEYGVEGMVASRGCRGQLRSIHGWPYLVSASAKGGNSPSERCDAFLSEWGTLFGMGDPGMALALDRLKRDDRGGSHCIYQQEYYGVPVDRMRFVVHLDPEGRVRGANGEFIARMDDPPDPGIDAADALLAAQVDAPALSAEAPELVVYLPPQRGVPRVAWKVLRRSASGMPYDAMFLSAATGEHLATEPLVHSFGGEIQQVWDNQWGDGISPSPILRFQNHSPAVNDECDFTRPECFSVSKNQALASYLWSDHFGRDSWDDAGGLLQVNYDRYEAAAYGPEAACAIAHSPGGGYTFLAPGITDLDVICHEAGHSMDSAEVYIRSGIGPFGEESRAIKEHFGDIHGMWCNQLYGRQDWRLEYCQHDPDDHGPYTRRLLDDPPANPEVPGGTTGHFAHAGPDSWRWYESRPCSTTLIGCELSGHRNAGILNKLAYLLHRTGTTTHHGVQVEGLGVETASWIFYDAMKQHRFPSDPTLHDYRDGLREACADLYGAGSHTCLQLYRAWHAVGLWYNHWWVPGDVGSRPAGLSWKGPGGTFRLYVFYKSATSNDIRWRWAWSALNYWPSSSEATVEINGVKPQTDQAVAVAQVKVGCRGIASKAEEFRSVAA
jgi:Zn-dependent metalloprotease